MRCVVDRGRPPRLIGSAHSNLSSRQTSAAPIKPKLILVLTEDWFFCSHFMQRAAAARDVGYDVTVMARENGARPQVRAAGFGFLPLPLNRRGLGNPLAEDRRRSRAILVAYRRLRPALVHHVSLKPMIYGAIAARIAGVRSLINAPVGLGYVFASRSFKSQLLRPLIWLALRFAPSILAAARRSSRTPTT